MPEKSGRYKIIFALCFVVVMAAFGIFGVVAYLNNNINTQQYEDNYEKTAVVTSFRELYPFENDELPSTATEQSDGILTAYEALANTLTASVEQYTTAFNPLSLPAQNIIFKIDGITGNSIIPNGEQPFVRLANGHFTYIFPYSRLDSAYDNIVDFSSWLKTKNIPYLTLIPANKSDDSITEFQEGIPHGYSQMNEEYKSFLDKNNLAYLDLKDTLLSKNSDFYSWFYKTDHHWNVNAARLVAEKTAKELNNSGIDIDFASVSENLFVSKVYPDSFLGNMGRKLSIGYAEDFEILYPIEQTDYRIEIPSLGIDKTGNFEEVMIDKTQFSEDFSTYSAFLYGCQALIRIENKTCDNSTRVLVIKKSNAHIVCPYLSLSVRNLDIIDPRYFDGSIRSFIEQTNPDIVIVCSAVPENNEEDQTFWRLK